MHWVVVQHTCNTVMSDVFTGGGTNRNKWLAQEFDHRNCDTGKSSSINFVQFHCRLNSLYGPPTRWHSFDLCIRLQLQTVSLRVGSRNQHSHCQVCERLYTLFAADKTPVECSYYHNNSDLCCGKPWLLWKAVTDGGEQMLTNYAHSFKRGPTPCLVNMPKCSAHGCTC